MKKRKLQNYFTEKPEYFITKINIATAIRRFISRYLVGIREDNDINNDDELFLNDIFFMSIKFINLLTKKGRRLNFKVFIYCYGDPLKDELKELNISN